MFSRGFLLTFTFHCYREGAISNVYVHAYVHTYVCMYVYVALKSSRLTGTTESLNLKQFVQKKI